MTTKTTSSLLDSLRAANQSILSNANGVHKHGERFFVMVSGVEVIDGKTFLVGNEPFRGYENIKIHVKDPALDVVKRGNETIQLRKFSKLVETGAVRLDDMVVFKDVEPIPGVDGVFMAYGYETPFNNIQSEEAVKSTTVNSGYMSLEGKEHPQVVLYQNNPAMVGTLAELQQLPAEDRKVLLMDGQFMANLRTENDLVAWANTQFTLKRPVTVRAIVKGEDGQYQSVGVKVNPVTVEQTNETDKSVYRVHSIEASMDSFLNSKEVQEITKLMRIAAQGNFNVDTFEKGGQMMIEGIPTLRVNDAYRNIADEYARLQKNIFERTRVSLDNNRSVLQNVALQAVLITKNTIVNTPTGNRETVRVAGGSGLLQAKTEAYMLSELPTPNFFPSADMGMLRDQDVYIGANRSMRDDDVFRALAASHQERDRQPGDEGPEVQYKEALQPVTQQEVTQQPVVQQEVTQQPVVQQEVTQQPVVQQEVTQQPVVQHQELTTPEDEFGTIDIVDDAVDEDDLAAALSGLSGFKP
jgi:hypothetical protein